MMELEWQYNVVGLLITMWCANLLLLLLLFWIQAILGKWVIELGNSGARILSQSYLVTPILFFFSFLMTWVKLERGHPVDPLIYHTTTLLPHYLEDYQTRYKDHQADDSN